MADVPRYRECSFGCGRLTTDTACRDCRELLGCRAVRGERLIETAAGKDVRLRGEFTRHLKIYRVR